MICPILKIKEKKRTFVKVVGGQVDFLDFFPIYKARLDGRNVLVSDENHFQTIFSASDSKPKGFTIFTYTCETARG